MIWRDNENYIWATLDQKPMRDVINFAVIFVTSELKLNKLHWKLQL